MSTTVERPDQPGGGFSYIVTAQDALRIFKEAECHNPAFSQLIPEAEARVKKALNHSNPDTNLNYGPDSTIHNGTDILFGKQKGSPAPSNGL